MAVFNIYSKRQKILRGDIPEIFTFEIPTKLRVQIIHILNDGIGVSNERAGDDEIDEYYMLIHDILCREYGETSLVKNISGYKDQVQYFISFGKDSEQVLDAVELAIRLIENVISDVDKFYKQVVTIKMNSEEVIEEINQRFKENGVGYSYEKGEFLRVDNTFIHEEVTKPVLSLLYNKKFDGACDEYLKAHEHYRHGRNKECLAECLKAFESTLKIICNEKGWEFDNQKDTAKKLIQICLLNGLLPGYLETQMAHFRALLETGLPVIRNKTSGHGQGNEIITVDESMARYGLNLTGTNIIFVVEQSKIK